MKSIKDFGIEVTEQYTRNEGCGVLEFRCLNRSDCFTLMRNILLGCSFKDCISVYDGTNSAVDKFILSLVDSHLCFAINDAVLV